MKYIVGLGNPEEKYIGTRHNIGRDIVFQIAKKFSFEDFQYEKKINALISVGKIEKQKVTLILPDAYMNRSGISLKKIIDNKNKALNTVVIHDDLDMGFGAQKIVFGKKSGGHLGIESIIKSIKTIDFIRIKIGISPTTPSGKIKKPTGSKEVVNHVLGNFNKKESVDMKKIIKKTIDSVESIVLDGYMIAMNKFN
ncbi:MAG TPA: aminoacyl-tRNA hydrolase [Candidatus Paceibacterota bacterium]|nr:aminoacyl-tRNA hydrolase [Candidatus Paceibacterota bacterium]HMP18838.1 aminoacyl-tRNA hydrolase [Candidatus Paceibacterota bacterium]HMP85370.1 aminoacyl-tRNA hydrolase [Candidatus Paceibacterota bacterium]